ncbi:Blue-light-activated protein [Planctomycetes bacterium Pan216]|uniref:histidine kinase n=1 Tax=Kolteria novifilia TaxID=2527975 RepID=A0A518BBH8_9BACT|nr:Blue-light-activated protein [Planctomycetes bacterium Pan216]
MKPTLRVLLVEDCEDDYAITRALLSKSVSTVFTLDWVRNVDEALEWICRREHDVYLVDFQLGRDTGLELIAQARERDQSGPFILLTGMRDSELDLKALHTGAADYLPKDGLAHRLLERTIHFSIEREALVGSLQSRVRQLTTLWELADAFEYHGDKNEVCETVCRVVPRAFPARSRPQVSVHVGDKVHGEPPSGVEVMRKSFRVEEEKEGRVVLWSEDPSFDRDAFREEYGEFLDFVSHNLTQTMKRLDLTRQLQLIELGVRQARDSIMITDALLDAPGPRIVYANAASQELTGYRPEELIGNSPRILQGPKTDRSLLANLRQTMEEGNTFQGVTINYHKDGTEFVNELRVMPIRDNDGIVMNWMAIQRDVTEETQLRDMLRDREEQLRQSQKMEAVGCLAGGIAHDFNNLLTGISGFTRLLLSGESNEAKQHDLNQVLELSDRASELTSQLLAFSRKQTIKPKVIKPNHVLEESTKLLRRLIRENVELRMSLGEDVGHVKFDPGQFHQVVVNLAVNASDAMPDGGMLKIVTEKLEQTIGDPAGSRQITRQSVQLIVSDTGVGMDEETTKRIFEPFFTSKEKGRGTGLGLATVYGIVKQHGANITVSSLPGQGTTFKVIFPRVDEPETATEKEPSPEKISLAGTTILIVEDEGAVREVAERMLKESGATVLTASMPSEALALCVEQEPDLLLSDVVLPEMSGRQLYLRLLQLFPSLRVFYMSGYTDEVFGSDGMVDDDIPIIQKPFDAQQLRSRISALLRSPSAV